MSKWWDESWNPVSGCTPCSPGCEHCYAERMAFRLGSMPNNNGYDPPPAHFKVKLHPERLLAPAALAQAAAHLRLLDERPVPPRRAG